MSDTFLDAAQGPRTVAADAVTSGDPWKALERYECHIAAGQDDLEALANYGVLLWRLFEFDRAGSVFDRVLDDARMSAEIAVRIARCYFEIGRFGQAARVMHRAVAQLDRPDAEIVNTLAWTLERDNQAAAAREHAQAALAIDARYAPAVRLLAHLDRRAGNFAGAARRLRDFLEHHTTPFDWGLRYELAAVLDRLEDYESAWHELMRAKSQLHDAARGPLAHSRSIRHRQWELARSVTLADWRRWRRDGAEFPSRQRICFLTGFPRSGTTLLEQMIAAHADAIDTDETGILTSQFIEPIVWKAEDVSTAIVEIRSFDHEQLRVGRDTFLRFTESFLGQPLGGRLLIEKNPLLTADLALPLRLFPEASVLVALRDPRDVVLSYLFTMVPLNWSSAPAVSVPEACQFYAETMRHRLLWRNRLDSPWHELRYEDVVRDAATAIQRVAEFLGLTWDAEMLDERHRSARRAIRTPTYDDVTRPLYARSIGRWRNYVRHLEPGLPFLEPFVQMFGYDR